MEKGGVSSMDASIQDVWEWEVLPDEHRSFYAESRPGHAHGSQVLGDQDTAEPILPPPSDDTNAKPVDDECKDIGVVAPAETKSSQEETMVSDEEEAFESSDAKALDDEPGEVTPKQYAEEEEDGAPAARPECVVFSVGKLRFNGIGALCSFGVAAATVCIFLVGGRLQHQQKQQQQKIQLQFLGDDKRMQQVVQQTSRLNQAMSSLMGGGASTRANISFGGFYDGF